MQVDRRNRDKLVDAIRRYFAEKITAFDFDDEIFRIRDESADSTVNDVVLSVWTLYDDCKDHKVVLSKEAWDYCQRLILVLESDAHIETVTRKRWSITQLVAGAALLAFVACAAWLGIGIHLFAIAVPFGLVSMALYWLRETLRRRRASTEEIAVMPFSGIAEILAVRRRVPTFSRWKYPRHLTTRRIRSPVMDFALRLPLLGAWLMMSPVALLVQMFPETETQSRVTAC